MSTMQRHYINISDLTPRPDSEHQTEVVLSGYMDDVLEENRRLALEYIQAHKQNAKLVGEHIDLRNKLRVALVDGNILRGLVYRFLGRDKNVFKDARAYLPK